MDRTDDLLALFSSGVHEFGERVHTVADDQWSAPTPDREWSVADLVAHVVDEHRWAAPLLHGLDLDSARKVVEGTRDLPVGGGVGANLAQEWDEAALASANAWNEPGALERTVALSRGDTPARDYLAEMTFDLCVHSWDLGTAIGSTRPLPDDLVRHTYEWVRDRGDMSSGLFDAPVDVPDDASTLDKLLAATGRQPR